MSYERVEYTDPQKYNSTNVTNLKQLYDQLGEVNGPKLTSILKEYKDQGKWRGFINEVLGSRDKSRLLNETLRNIYSAKVSTGNSRNATAAAAQQNALRRSGTLKPSPANPRQTQSAISGASGLGVANSMNARGPFRKPTAAAAASLGAATTATTAAVEPQRPRDPVRAPTAGIGVGTDPVDPDPRINALMSQVRELQSRPVVDLRILIGLEAELRRLQTAAGSGGASQAELNAVRTTLEGLRGQLGRTQEDIAGLRIDVNSARDRADREIAALRDQVRALAEAQRAAASQAATATAAVPPAAAALQGTVQGTGQTTVVIRETTDQSLASIERIVANHEQTVRAMNAEQAQLVTEMNRAAQNYNRQIATNAARSSEAAAARTAEAISRLGAETTRQIEIVVAGFREALGPISAALNGLPAMIAAIQANGGTNDAQIETLIAQNSKLSEDVGHLKAQVAALEKQFTEFRTELRGDLNGHKKEIKQDIKELRDLLESRNSGAGAGNSAAIIAAFKELTKAHMDGLSAVIGTLKSGPAGPAGPSSVTVTTTGTPAGMNAKAELIELGAAREKLKELELLKARLAALEKAKANAPTPAAERALNVKINAVKTDLTAATTSATSATTAVTATAPVTEAVTTKNTTKGCQYGWRNVSCRPGKPCKHRINCGSKSGGHRRTRYKNNSNNSNKRKYKTHKTHKTHRRARR
jgi:predicted  nucleic acid-binding Zn-ribbon protein